MTASSLPEQIETLVDHLRENRDADLSMADVAAITEVLIGSMRTFFRGIDTKIYRECREMSEYIMNARHEIASLQPKDLESARIPRAGLELDAIVQQTEEATNTIMESAEAIMNADPSDSDGYAEMVQDHILRIFEACSFQDITGQRISKVVETLTYIEERVHELRSLMGVTETDIEAASEPEEKDEVGTLTRGPALDGEGIDQTLVDELIGGGFQSVEKASDGLAQGSAFDIQETGAVTPSAESKPAEPSGQPAAPEPEKADASPAPAAAPPAAESSAAPAPAADSEASGGETESDDDEFSSLPSGDSTQEDIDSLFN